MSETPRCDELQKEWDRFISSDQVEMNPPKKFGTLAEELESELEASAENDATLYREIALRDMEIRELREQVARLEHDNKELTT